MIVDPSTLPAEAQAALPGGIDLSHPFWIKMGRHPEITCFALRTYVMKRDSKDSDTTQPAGYSSCQPSAQFQLYLSDGTAVPDSR